MKALDIKKPSDLEEAYSLLNSQNQATLIAGGLFLRLHKRTYPLLIDLEGLGLDYIKEIKDGFIIGAMTTLRDIEKSHLPKALVESVHQISGVGVRNMATIGGSVSGRYPFSDINTALMALDAYLVFYKKGKVALRDFMANGLDEKDILIEIYVKKPTFSSMKYFKKVYTDLSIVNLALVDHDIAIGARPSKSLVISNVDFRKSTKEILSSVVFKDDHRASGDYRRALAEALLEDILNERSTYGS